MGKIIDTLSSRRVTVYFFIIFIVVSIFGALVPQRQQPAYYEAHYRPWAVALLRSFQLTDVYHAWYFIGLLIYLLLSLVTCTIRRITGIWKPFQKPKGLPGGFGECAVDVGPAGVLPRVISLGEKLGLKWGEGTGFYYARKKRFAVWGEHLTHFGLIAILIAGGLKLAGKREQIFIFEGQRIALPAEFGPEYELAVDKVEEIADVNTGKIVEFRTTAKLFRNGRKVAEKAIEVNGPLLYGGLGIYQSSMDARGMRGLVLEVTKLKSGYGAEDYGAAVFRWEVAGETGEVFIKPGETKELGDTGCAVNYLEYYEHFIADEEGIKDENPEFNPAAFFAVTAPDGTTGMAIVFQLYPDFSALRFKDRTPWADKIILGFKDPHRPPTAADRREYIFASGSTLPLPTGGERVTVAMEEGEGEDLRARRLRATLVRNDGRRQKLQLPFGMRVPVKLKDGNYFFRFAGAKVAPVTGLTVNKDPGVGVFYAGCLLLSLGVAIALLWRYDEFFLFVREGKTYFAGRSAKGPTLFLPVFREYVERIKRLDV